MESKNIIEHLEELRGRLIKCVLFVIICSLIAYSFSSPALKILTEPVNKLIFIAPQEAFITHLKVSFLIGIASSSPFIIYQIWKFVEKGLTFKEKRYILIFGPLSFILFILGLIFGYKMVIPLGIRLLLSFSSDFLYPMISVEKYISFVGSLSFALGIIFQLPLVMLFLTKIKTVSLSFWIKRRREAVVSVFILAAIFTPPDVVSQLLMALPLIILYETGVIITKLIGNNRL